MASLPFALLPFNPPSEASTSLPGKVICSTRNVQCTHITMTRIYSGRFRCAICLEKGSMGWLYRCTQDRELLIEDDMEQKINAPFDKLATLYPPPTSAKKGSPAARTSSNLAFLEEMGPEGFKTYTPLQLRAILRQREQVLNAIKESKSSTMIFETEGLCLGMPSDSHLPNSKVAFRTSEIHGSAAKKPWLPTQECQFKCCQQCRPTFGERSYLSLNAIADGELPATAIAGFGFQYQKERPVALVKHVRNLGLRPNPIRIKKLRQGRQFSLFRPSPSCSEPVKTESVSSSSPFDDEQNADTTFGQLSNAYDSTAMTRSINIELEPLSHGRGSSFGTTIRRAFQDVLNMRRQGADTESIKKLELSHDLYKTAIRPLWTPPNSPKFQKEATTAEGPASEDNIPGFDRRSSRLLKTDRYSCSKFNLDEVYPTGDEAMFPPPDDALLNRASAIALPPETLGEGGDNDVSLRPTDDSTAHQALLQENMDKPVVKASARKESVRQGALGNIIGT